MVPHDQEKAVAMARRAVDDPYCKLEHQVSSNNTSSSKASAIHLTQEDAYGNEPILWKSIVSFTIMATVTPAEVRNEVIGGENLFDAIE